MGNLGRSSIQAYEHVHPVMILPQRSDLHPVQVAWLTQGVYYVFADYGLQLLTLLFLLIRVLLILLLHWHCFFQIVVGGSLAVMERSFRSVHATGGWARGLPHFSTDTRRSVTLLV